MIGLSGRRHLRVAATLRQLGLAVALSVLAGDIVAQSAPPATTASSPVGTWRGTSPCLVRPSACTDEVVAYHVALPEDADSVYRRSRAVRLRDPERGNHPARGPNRITIIADAFGGAPGLERDWGYSALVEYDGRRILFDTGNDSARFAVNVAALGVDLRDLDAVVISHRHGDHTDGLHHIAAIHPQVRIYAPSDEYFGGLTPSGFFRRPDPTLPPDQRYFGGDVPAAIPHGSPWRGLEIMRGAGGTVLAPGIRLVENLAPGREFGETPELTLVIDTPEGQVVLVGCSHPGIERILGSIAADSRPVALLAGGLHLLNAPDEEVERVAGALRTRWGVKRIAPGHCSGEYTFAVLRRVFGSAFVHAGVGEVIPL